MTKKGSIKETGEEVSQEDWERFDAAVGAGGDTSRRPAAPRANDAPPKTPAKEKDPADRP